MNWGYIVATNQITHVGRIFLRFPEKPSQFPDKKQSYLQTCLRQVSAGRSVFAGVTVVGNFL